MNNEISNIKYQISNSLKKIVKELTDLEIEPEITVNSDLSKGDYSTNVAMVAFGKIKNNRSNLKSATELAKQIVGLLNTKYLIPDTFRLIEAKEPGFINFYISFKYLSESISSLLIDKKKIAGKGKSHFAEAASFADPRFAGGFGEARVATKAESRDRSLKRVALEFGDPNPFKEFHIGHLRNIILGESLSRITEYLGNEPIRLNYQGDVGLHVAKATWGIQNSKFKIQNLNSKSLKEKAKFLGEAYARGAKAYEEDKEARKDIIEINKKIYSDPAFAKASAGKPEIMEIWKKGREWSLSAFEEIYKRLGTKYDGYYFESQTAPLGKDIVLDHVDDGIFQKDDGAIIFKGSHTRVFVTGEGYSTYEAKDLALAHLKEKDLHPDISIIITANEQKEYFRVLLEALAKVNREIADKTRHYSFGFVFLEDGKMSSREGNVITAEWLLEETKKRLRYSFKETSDEALEALTVGAVKYSMLKFGRESDIRFSFDDSISLNGNSGPYLQYTYARINTLVKNSKLKVKSLEFDGNLEKEEEEILRFLIHFPEVVEQAGENFVPNLIANYLYGLSQRFNLFYEKHRVIGSEKEGFRLALSSAVGKVLKEGLYLLGIESPEKI